MDWQQLVSLVVVAGAAVFVLGGKWRRRKFSFERHTHCGCATVRTSSPRNRIVLRVRKGERPEIRVRMG